METRTEKAHRIIRGSILVVLLLPFWIFGYILILVGKIPTIIGHLCMQHFSTAKEMIKEFCTLSTNLYDGFKNKR